VTTISIATVASSWTESVVAAYGDVCFLPGKGLGIEGNRVGGTKSDMRPRAEIFLCYLQQLVVAYCPISMVGRWARSGGIAGGRGRGHGAGDPGPPHPPPSPIRHQHRSRRWKVSGAAALMAGSRDRGALMARISDRGCVGRAVGAPDCRIDVEGGRSEREMCPWSISIMFW
jgi:hypothetical protein